MTRWKGLAETRRFGQEDRQRRGLVATKLPMYWSVLGSSPLLCASRRLRARFGG